MATKRKPTSKAKAAIHETEEVARGKKALARKTLALSQRQPPPPMTASDEEALLRLLAILETGFLATAADGVVDEPEFDNLGTNFAFWLDQELSSEDLREVIEGFLEHLEEDGFDGRLQYLSETLDEGSRRVAFDFASLMVACDGDVSEAELGVVGQIAGAFGLARDEAQKRFNDMCRHVTSGE